MRPDETPVQIRFGVAELCDGMTPEKLTEMVGLALTAAKLLAPAEPQTTKATSSM